MASPFLGALTGGAIGGAVVNLTVNDTGLKSGLATAQTETRAATVGMGKNLEALKVLGAAAFTALAAAAVKFAADSVRAALEAQAAQTELTNSIENSKTVTTQAIPVFNAQAEAIRKLTGADDEAITSAQAFLVQMGLTQKQVTELTPLIVDLATKMDVDFQTAAKAVGKAVNGNVGSLSRMGVVVDENDAKVNAYSATLDALSVAQGFAAEKAKDEPWRLLASTWEEVQEQVGQQLLPALQDLAAAMVPLAEDIGPLLAAAFEKLAVAMEQASIGAQVLHGDLGALTDVNLGLLGSILKNIPGMDGLSAALDNADTIINAYKGDTDAATGATNDLTGAADDSAATWKDLGVDLHKVSAKMRELRQAGREAFESLVLDLSNTATQAGVTRTEFIKASHAMTVRAEQLGDAMVELSHQKWVPKEYIDFLRDQGPEFLIGFTRLNKEQQHQVVQDWKSSTDEVDRATNANNHLLDATKKLGQQRANPTITFNYKVAGDPALQQFLDLSGSKP